MQARFWTAGPMCLVTRCFAQGGGVYTDGWLGGHSCGLHMVL